MFGHLFNKSFFGLDISGDSLKFIELIKDKNGFQIGRYGERTLPLGVSASSELKNGKQLEKIISSLRKEEGMKSVRVALPSEELKNRKDYLSLFNKSGITVDSFESDAGAISRSVLKEGDMGTYMVVNFGRKSTLIFIVSKGVVVFTFVSDVSGEALTEMLQKKLGVSFEEAEKMKRKSGLIGDTSNGGVFSILLDGVSVLRDEIEKYFLYWHIHKNKEDKKNIPIKKIIFCGSEAGLPGLSQYLSASLKNRVELANVWTNVLNTEKKVPEIGFKQSLGFAAAVGVALRDF